MWRRRTRPVPGGTRAFVYALALHVAVLLLLGISLRFSARTPSEPPQVVQATVVEEAPKRVEPPDTARLDVQRRKQAEEVERARQAELKKREDERKQKAEEARLLKEAERKKELERKKKAEAAEKKKAAALEKRRAEERLKKAAEEALQSEVAAEELRRRQEQQERQDSIAVATAIDAITQKVQRNWSKPAGQPTGLVCTLQVRTVPSGEVVSAVILRSSGNAVFDRSVENAIYKATPLPVPTDQGLYERKFRVFNFDFKSDK